MTRKHSIAYDFQDAPITRAEEIERLPEFLADRIERIANKSEGSRGDFGYSARIRQIELLEIADEVRLMAAELADLKRPKRRWWTPWRRAMHKLRS